MRDNFIISSDKNNGYPTFSDASDFENVNYYQNQLMFLTTDGYPIFKNKPYLESSPIVNTDFYADGKNYLQMKNVRFSLLFGAFANDTSLTKVVIPKSVKLIGDTAFRNTALSSAKISSDCIYSSESFPDGCKVEFY